MCGPQHSALGIDPAHCVCTLFPFLPSGVPWCPAPSEDIWVVSSVWPSLNKAAMNIHVQILVKIGVDSGGSARSTVAMLFIF